MLFRKKIERSCRYCVRSTLLEDGQVLCSKKGFGSNEGKCFRFKYDPLKRVPAKAKALDFARYEDTDFTL